MNASSPIEAVQQARAQTLAVGSARLAITSEFPPIPAMPDQELSPVRRAVWAAASFVGRRVFRAATHDFNWRVQEYVGFVDFARRRYTVANEHFAVMYADGAEWAGTPGRPVASLARLPSSIATPFWLIDGLAGVTDAVELGFDEIRGTLCRHLGVTFDLSKASAAVEGGVAAPSVAHFEDLLALKADIWLDEDHVRRAQLRSDAETETVEFWDFGASLMTVDWTRLLTRETDTDTLATAR